MHCRPLDPFGCEVTDVDLRTISDNDLDQLLHQTADHGVSVVRDQSLGDGQLVTFLERFAPMTFTAGEDSVPDHPQLNEVSNLGRTRPPRSVFHSDTSYVSHPPSFTALIPLRLPERGGETLFSNQYRAYDRLSRQFTDSLAGATVLHRATGVSLGDADQRATRHPLFRRHPVTGRTALYLSTPERCVELSGHADAASAATIKQLFEHSIEDPHLYRHQWRPGDLLMWDNRCTMHRADHSGVVGDRVFHRGMVSGESPLLADQVTRVP